MKKSVFFFKELTDAEVGKTKTHEVYIRCANNFDYDIFFNNSAVDNGSVIECSFNVVNKTPGEHFDKVYALRFAYFYNSNKEKRIPSLAELFNENQVDTGDIVCLENRVEDGNVTYHLTFHKKGTMMLSPSSIVISRETPMDMSSNRNVDTKEPLQQIFYGAPGTGKSNTIEERTNDTNRIRTTFHPDSDYSTFVGAYKPTMEETGELHPNGDKKSIISYSFVPQAFLKAYVNAWMIQDKEKTPYPYYLVIEEINRGNCAQIFGDLFQLLDRGPKGDSKYDITPDDDIRRHLADQFKDCTNIPAEIKLGKRMRLPNNLYIWATMNTSDQSLFPIDSAFKRRWEWEYVPIEDGKKGFYIDIDGKKYDWWNFIETINMKIDSITGSEDKKLGYWFAKPAGDSKVITKKQFISKVLFYLWNDVYKDYADSTQSIFRKKIENKEEKLPFTSFFGEKATENILAFMKYNGVKFEGEDNPSSTVTPNQE